MAERRDAEGLVESIGKGSRVPASPSAVAEGEFVFSFGTEFARPRLGGRGRGVSRSESEAGSEPEYQEPRSREEMKAGRGGVKAAFEL